MNLKPTPKQYHIIYRNIAGSMRQTWIEATQHHAAISQFKQELWSYDGPRAFSSQY
jgi:hypothetical protein